MAISDLIKPNRKAIFDYCETKDPSEFARLLDKGYSKEAFDINYAFCKKVSEFTGDGKARFHVRYWADVYLVHGVQVRVANDWYDEPKYQSRSRFLKYLSERGIARVDDSTFDSDTADNKVALTARKAARGRYRGNAIGNAQNLLVRNILSRLGDEQFSASDWESVKADFGNLCAYCGSEEKLVMEHVVPINKQALGEHRLGNLVPACRTCNAKKAEQGFRAFLAHDPARIAAIEAHMVKHGYTPIGENERLGQIIEFAHQELRQLSDRYVEIINAALKGELE